MKKFTRRAVALLLAVLLVAALPLNVSAASYYDWKDIGGYEYYVTLNCKTTSVYGSTETACKDTTVGVYVEAYSSSGTRITQISSENCTMSAIVSATLSRTAARATGEHYVDGVTIYETSANAS